jgi:hypothetical protein
VLTHALASSVAALFVFAALAGPASAVLPGEEPGGWQWTWGHNNVGPVYNTWVFSGWNYWTLQYVHKHNGGSVFIGFQHTDNSFCFAPVWGGPWEIYQTPGDLNCGGYLRNFVTYNYSPISYLYMGAN